VKPLRLIAAIAAALALCLPALAAAQEGPPPEDIPAPPPTTTTTPTEPVEPTEPTGPTTMTITVPPLPAQKTAPKKAAPQKAKAAPKATSAPVQQPAPRRSDPVESYSQPEASEEPAAEPEPAKPVAKKAKAAKRKAHRTTSGPNPRVVATAVALPASRPIRDPQPVGAVLGARFTLAGEDGGTSTGVIVLALVLIGLVGSVAAVVGAAPILADRWPKLFVPVIESTDRIVLAGLCVGGAMVALVITWALTGPSG
jgi:hypothetical protein